MSTFIGSHFHIKDSFSVSNNLKASTRSRNYSLQWASWTLCSGPGSGLANLVPRADFVLFRFDFTEQSTLETTPGINQFDWLMTSRLCHKLTVWLPWQYYCACFCPDLQNWNVKTKKPWKENSLSIEWMFSISCLKLQLNL